jgi:hypothetical protein
LPVAASIIPASAEIPPLRESHFANRAAAAGAHIPGDQAFLLLAGFWSAGDAQELLAYRRVPNTPRHTLFFRSADGAFWEYIAGPNGANVVAAGMNEGAADNAASWRAALAYSANYGTPARGIESHFIDLFVPSGVYHFADDIRWDPAHGGISAYGAHFTFKSGGISIESSNPEDGTNYRNHRAVLRGLSVFGSGNSSGLRFTPKTNETAHITLRDMNIGGWDIGVEFGENAHTITLESCAIYFNNVGVKDNGTQANSGENIRCINSEIFNNAVTGFRLANANATYTFNACSIDYNGLGKRGESQFDTDVGQFRYTDCHIEGGIKGPVMRGNRTNSKSTFCGCYFLQTQPSVDVPFIDLKDGAYVTMLGCQFAPHPATRGPIRVRRGASLVDIDCYYNYNGSAVVAEKGSRRASLNAAIT